MRMATAIGATLALLWATPAAAIEFAGDIYATTNYVSLGLSESQGTPSIAAELDALGLWYYIGDQIETVNFGTDPARYENILFGGLKHEVLGVTWELGFSYFHYVNALPALKDDYTYIRLQGVKPVGNAVFGFNMYHSFDFFGGTGPATYLEGNAQYAFADNSSVSGAFGYEFTSKTRLAAVYGLGNSGYATWNVGYTYPIRSDITIDLRYIGTTDSATDYYIVQNKHLAGHRIVFSLKFFPPL